MVCGDADVSSFATEVFVSTLERGRAFIRWSLPHLLYYLFGNDFNSKFMYRRLDSMVGFLESFHLDVASHFFDSWAAVSKQFHVRGQYAPSSKLLEHDPDFSVSTQGLVAILSSIQWSKLNVSTVVVARCDAILTWLVRKFVPTNAAHIMWLDSERTRSIRIEGQHVVIEANGPGRAGLASLRSGFEGQLVGIPQALQRLTHMHRRPSKFKCSAEASVAVRWLTSLLAGSVEVKRGDASIWDVANHMALPWIASGSPGRCRRISVSVKRCAEDLVATDDGIKSVVQLLATRGSLETCKVRGRPRANTSGRPPVKKDAAT